MNLKYLLLALVLLFVVSGCVLIPPDDDNGNGGNGDLNGNGGNGNGGTDGNVIDNNVNGDQNGNNGNGGPPILDDLEELIEGCRKRDTVLQIDNCIIAMGGDRDRDEVCELMKERSLDSCYFDIGVVTNNSDTCGKITDAERRNNCIYDAAVDSADQEHCQIIETDFNLTLKDLCIKAVSISHADEEECFPIVSTLIQDDCFYELAQLENSDILCNLISNEIRQGAYYKDDCNMEIFDSTKDAALCSKIMDVNRSNHCFIDASEGNADFESCQKIADINAFDSCANNIAQSSKNYTYCNEMNFENNTVNCLQELADANYFSIELCQSFPGMSQEYDCVYDLAIRNMVANTCNEIEGDFGYRDDCIREIAVATDNPNLCADYRILDYDKTDDCYSTIALSKLDLELCRKIYAGKQYILCFGNIAIEIEDIDLCNNIDKNFPTEKYDSANQCRYQYATHFLNEALCEKILHPVLREECEDTI